MDGNTSKVVVSQSIPKCSQWGDTVQGSEGGAGLWGDGNHYCAARSVGRSEASHELLR